MAKHIVKKGATSRVEYLFIQDSASAVGAGKTGLAFNTASLTAYYVRRGAAPTAITLVTQTVTGAFSSGGFVEVDATNMPGLYRLDVPDAAFATGVNKVIVMLKGASGMAPVLAEFQLVNFDPEDAAGLGLTNLDATVSSRLAAAGYTAPLDAAGTRSAIGLASANLDTQIDDLPTNAELATALAGADDAVLAQVALVKAKTDNIPTDPADASDIAGSFSTVNSTLSTIAGFVDTEIAAIKAKTDLIPASPAATSDIPSAASIADAVWDEAIAGHAGAGSTGEALSAAGGGAAPTATEVADAVLRRQFDEVDDSGGTRDILNALRFMRNGFEISGATLTVLKEDDTTPAYTRDLATDAGADPIVGVS